MLLSFLLCINSTVFKNVGWKIGFAADDATSIVVTILSIHHGCGGDIPFQWS